ncbi:MAG: HAMP domain-containing protein [Deltaproteobacteria bacterium]|nr:HAMP domain-containing protein [Deltaproteobacteria bacterium]
MSTAVPAVTRRRRGGLFARIFITFVVAAIASAIVAGLAGFTFATRFSAQWVAEVEEQLEDYGPRFQAAVGDPLALQELTQELGEQVDATVGVFGPGGRKVAGEGPARLPRGHRRRHNPQRRGKGRPQRTGKPRVLPGSRMEPPVVVYGLSDPVTGKPAVRLGIVPRPGFRLFIPIIALSLMLPVLGGGAWVVSRSLARRLAQIEGSADRIARGDLHHRIALPEGAPRDELDQMGAAFNEMADKVEALLQGQRTLLANVSHELRTPIARMKVLIEILQDRVTTLRDRGDESRPVQRLDKGLVDLGIDITEVETLISDLLTSGRLELRHGAAATLQTTSIDVHALLSRVAAKADARVELDGQPQLVADELLLERLLSNLLANARRACPDGRLSVHAKPDGDMTELAVADEGPGVDPEHRETIFEPFTRLDQARDRDRGGVGLGLYLCRQICLSHGGTIVVTDRPDGASGAYFVVRLPARGPQA